TRPRRAATRRRRAPAEIPRPPPGRRRPTDARDRAASAALWPDTVAGDPPAGPARPPLRATPIPPVRARSARYRPSRFRNARTESPDTAPSRGPARRAARLPTSLWRGGIDV